MNKPPVLLRSPADFVNSYAFDSAGRMNRITQTDGNASAGYAVKDKRVDVSYDAAGRFSAINRYESLAATNAVNKKMSIQRIAIEDGRVLESVDVSKGGFSD